jgi:hypothetical protein
MFLAGEKKKKILQKWNSQLVVSTFVEQPVNFAQTDEKMIEIIALTVTLPGRWRYVIFITRSAQLPKDAIFFSVRWPQMKNKQNTQWISF